MRAKNIKYFLVIILQLNVILAFTQDLKLWYRQPAVKWTEALPVGNGRIGAMIFGGIENDRVQFNEETLWTGEPRSYSRPGAYKYLDTIRQLLFAGKQKEAENLATREFMGLKSFEEERNSWLTKVMADKEFAEENFNDSQWSTMTVPSWDGWETVGHDGLDGAVWLRTSFVLPDDWVEKDLWLDLNRIRDHDYTYINGRLIGSQQNNEGRKYPIGKNVLHKGENTIAILVLNFTDKGGIYGYKDTAKHIGIYSTNNEEAIISLNGQWKYLIQNDSPPAVGTYQASYQPFGDLFLKFKNVEHSENYRRELDLTNAIVTTSYSIDATDYRREYFVSQPHQAIVINFSASRKSSISFSAELSSPHKNFETRRRNDAIVLSVKVRNGILRGESHMKIVAHGGSVVVNDSRIVIDKADRVTLFITAGTNFKNYDDVSGNPSLVCTNALFALRGKTYEQIKAAHVKEYSKYFNAFSINLGKNVNGDLSTDERLGKFAATNDPSFAALYLQYGRYLLISSSRPGTRPANLQGIWNDLLAPPWGSKYTTNINAEMNYWPAELLNLSPMHEPLFKMIEELSHTGRKTARDHYNLPGWVLHHNTDLWRGTAPINASNHGIWVTGGAWLCQHLWERYLFTRDKEFLRSRAYPLMKEAAVFFNSYLIKDPVSGYLISTPSNSPEQGGLVAGPSMDHQIIRYLFNSVIQAGRILNSDSTLRQSLKEKLRLIAPDKIGRHGQLQEWLADIDDTTNKHRHISHLWGMYPGNEINWDDKPELMKAARQSLLYRGDEATGWSLGWKINCWARFKDAEHAYTMTKMLLSPVKGGAGSYPNLFDAHPPFQIDGNFGGAAGIGEMILQSHTKYIDILPALPAAFADGEVKGICARGGFVLDMKWSHGQLQQLIIKSKAGGPLLIRYGNKILNIPTIRNGIYKLNASLNKL
ncbi:MAG: glycoside hydrolase family 95 protein [Chitinophagaceae bacterium]|nr:glycoside hydrolase family 95 protein [Chitinophagaceae bacterium]